MRRATRSSVLAAFAFATVALAGRSGDAAGPPEPALVTRADAVADLRSLVATIVAVHPNPFFHESRHDFDARVDAAIASFPDVETRVAFFRRVAPIVASIGDAHTSFSPYLSEIDRYADAGGRLFPLVVRYAGATPIVVVDYEADAPVPAGSVLDAIDGRPMESIEREIGASIATETLALQRVFVVEDLREWLWIDGFRPPFRIAYHAPDGTARTASLRGILGDTVDDWEATPAGKAYTAPYRFAMARDGIGDLTLHDFDADDGKFDEFLTTTFRRLAKSGARALVVDVRENDGGTTDVVTDLMNYLTAKPFRIMSLDRTKVSTIVKRSLGKKKYIDLYDATAWSDPDGTIEDTTVESDEPDPVSDRFAGKVYVLEGPGTFSSAAIFAATARDAHVAELLGQPSGGLATLYANGYEFKLPHTHLDVSASTEYFVRPDGDRRAAGVVPDRFLAQTSELGDDTELEGALDLIAAELGPGDR